MTHKLIACHRAQTGSQALEAKAADERRATAYRAPARRVGESLPPDATAPPAATPARSDLFDDASAGEGAPTDLDRGSDRADEGWVILEVHDDGPGVPDALYCRR